MSPSLSAHLLRTQSDQKLLELVAKGHERAFEAIVTRYRKPLLSYCRRIGLSDQRAEDVLQQSLLKVWLSLQAGTGVRELRPWLYRVVHNTAVNVIRSSREDNVADLDVTQPDRLAGESEFERRIAARQALSDVAALPPMQREAILLSAVDGRSHDEVAHVLGVSSGAVRGLLYRARAALRSAAAAFVPQPLISWASEGAGRLAPTAARIAELSAAGGGDAGGALLKGVAVAVTAAVAAGAVLVPLHGRGAHAGIPAAAAATPEQGAAAAAAITAAARVPASSATPLLAGRRPPALATPNGAGGGSGAARGVTTPSLRAGGGPSTTGRTGGPLPGTPAAATLEGASAATGTPGAGAPVDASAGAGHPAVGTPAPSGPPSGGSKPAGGSEGAPKPGGGEAPGSEAERERAEHEAEVARETTEREAEIAREKSDREAEEKREREEREREAREHPATTGTTPTKDR